MAYKTPEQMLELILDENLLTDACMTIIDGRNEFGFHAVEVPNCCIKNVSGNEYALTFVTDDEKNLVVNVKVPQPEKDFTFWLMTFRKGEYDVVCVQHEKTDEPYPEVKKKEYLSVIAMFLSHYKVGTRTKLMNILEYGYDVLKNEIGDNENAYKLIRDRMNNEIDVRRALSMPDKFGVRFNFHFDE